MAAAALALDAGAPWWRPHAALVPLLAGPDALAALNRAASEVGAVSGGDRPLCFGSADAAAGTPYETHIFATGEVPTRANAHDLFNALMWLAMPRFKRALNARQAKQLAAAGAEPGRRGAERDAATLLDESGVLLACRDAHVAAALAAHDWHEAFVVRRAAWGDTVHAVVCGHALLEKLQRPYKAITAHALVLDLALASPDGARARVALDAAAARRVNTTALAPRDLQPLPVLGIPGWSADNRDAVFYADRTVFRPARGAAAAGAGAEQRMETPS
jgi:hypothetical protein